MTLRVFCQFIVVAAQEGPGIVIAHPGQDVELLCTVNPLNVRSVAWYINHAGPFTAQQLHDGLLPGYSVNGTNLTVENIMMNDSRNDSEYRCVIMNTMIESDPTFLYVAGEYQYRRCELHYHTDVCMCDY